MSQKQKRRVGRGTSPETLLLVIGFSGPLGFKHCTSQIQVLMAIRRNAPSCDSGHTRARELVFLRSLNLFIHMPRCGLSLALLLAMPEADHLSQAIATLERCMPSEISSEQTRMRTLGARSFTPRLQQLSGGRVASAN